MAEFAEVSIELFSTAQGGRRSGVCYSANNVKPYRPHFRVCAGNGEYLGVEFIAGPDELTAPGSRAVAVVRFMYQPAVSYDLLVAGARFEVMEGARVVGAGTVTCRYSE